MIYLVTPTGNRQKGIDLLAQYIDEQTYSGPATWIIVDDCEPETDIPDVRKGIMTIGIRPSWRWSEGKNTQAMAMDRALEFVGKDDICIVMEDDDLYLPGHIESVLEALVNADLVGERISRYYNVATNRYRVMEGKYHASLASVGVKGEALKYLRDVCSGGSRRIDMELWRSYKGPKKLLETENVIGIKGLPGRPGIGVGHKQSFGTHDDGEIMDQWLGDYAENYLDLMVK